MVPADPRHTRFRLNARIAGQRGHVVGAAIATPREFDEALAPAEAVSWARFAGCELAASLTEALEHGDALLIVELSGPGIVDQSAVDDLAVADLLDLVGDEAPDSAVDTSEPEPEPEPEPEQHRVDVLVVNVMGEPQSGVAYELHLPDGTVEAGRTDADGRILHEGLTQTGDCQLTFPELANEQAA